MRNHSENGVKSTLDSCLLIKGSVIGYQHKTNPFERILDTGVLAFSSKYFGTSPTTLREGPQFHKNVEPPCSVKAIGLYLKPILTLLEVTNCDLQSSNSSLDSSNIKSEGKRVPDASLAHPWSKSPIYYIPEELQLAQWINNARGHHELSVL